MVAEKTVPKLLWDLGTAYDLFISQDVLHYPYKYAVPGAWAAGMRARLPDSEREILAQSQILVHVPIYWIYTLPKPRNGATVIWTLSQVPSAKRLPSLALASDMPPSEVADILLNGATRGVWDEKERKTVLAYYQKHCEGRRIKVPSITELNEIVNWWLRVEEFGDRYLEALQSYQEVFFAEEEHRILPMLEEALTRAQEIASRVPLPLLLEELSQGLQLVEPIESREIILSPSYWSTPLVFMGKTDADGDIWLYGARTESDSLVPGQFVPDKLSRALKALSDPTRLRILHYLAKESIAPAQLARRLRLRTPTVMHHLQDLRLAGLVQVTLRGIKEQRTYTIRPEAIENTFALLRAFLAKGEQEKRTVQAETAEQAQ